MKMKRVHAQALTYRAMAGLFAAIILATSPQPASACRPLYYSDTRFSFPRTDFAAVLWENATYVDVAVLQRTEPLDFASWIRRARAADLADAINPADRAAIVARYAGMAAEFRREGAAKLVFRSIESLKGQGPSEFGLNGFWTRGGSQWAASSGSSRDGLSPEAVWYANGPYELSQSRLTPLCFTWLGAKSDQPYLIFRDADGRLMTSTIPVLEVANSETLHVMGFVFAPVELSGDPWLEAVRSAADATRR